jgi:hypothetical protein
VAGYRLDELIGVGGSDCPVYRATHLRLRQEAALKLLPKERADVDFVRRFEREAQLAASLRDHPNVVAVYDFGDTEDVLYLAMRFVRGPDLGRLIAQHPLSLARTCVLLGQVAAALDAAHATGLVHRDVKPGNIFVDPASDRAYVGDFGLSLPRDTSMTRALWSGSPQYLAPERWTGSPPEPTVDVYALGCVAYFCLTGHPPFEGDVDTLRFSHANAAPPLLSAGLAAVPATVDEVLARAIAKQPGDRYLSCGEFVAALRAAAAEAGMETLSGPLPSDTPPPTRPPEKRRWPLAVVAVLVAAVLVPVLAGPTTPVDGTPEAVEKPAPGTSDTPLGPDLNGMVIDADGNLYLALRDTSTVKKLTPDGELTTVAGGNGEGFSGDGGPATKARLDFPHGLAVDAAGRLLIADSGNERIRRVEGNGTIITVAGTGESGADGDNGPAAEAELDSPVDVATGPGGEIYVAEADGNRVRRIDGGGRITTIAGTGVAGFAGDGGLATQAELDLPLALAVHGEDLYVADADNGRIRRIDTVGGTITTVAGNGGEEGDGDLATTTALETPDNIAVGQDGTLYIADRAADRVRRVSRDGLITTVAGTGAPGFSGDGGPGAKARVAGPNAVTVGADGTVYVGDTLNRRVRRIDATGVITTVVGDGPDYPGDGLKATDASLLRPRASRLGPDGAVYIADTDNHRVRRVGTDGVIATFAGTGLEGDGGDGGKATRAELSSPTGLDFGADGTLYIADSGNHRIRAVNRDGVITTVAGTGREGSAGDGGQADRADLNTPFDVDVADDGAMYIAEDGGDRIRKVGADGIITTVAGTGEDGFGGDGGPATEARLDGPTCVHVVDGVLYICDYHNKRLRKVVDGVITTVAGNGEEGDGGDGGPATEAQLTGPYAVATGADGSVYLADDNSHRVRRLDADGIITSVVGTGDRGNPDDGDLASAADLATPAGISVTQDGTLVITDINNDQVYAVGQDGVVHVLAGLD